MIQLKKLILSVAALCLVSGYVFAQESALSVPVAEQTKKQKKILDWYCQLPQIRAKTNDDVPSDVFVNVIFGYEKADKKATKELEERKIELIDFLRTFFSKCSEKDLSTENEKELKIKIRDCINNEILCNSKILEVRFLEFEVKRK
ncbi:MAG: flagellar basal body protein FliL [Treponema sp.]|nr:flagellar basal body protein FliL [Treponema sp.]